MPVEHVKNQLLWSLEGASCSSVLSPQCNSTLRPCSRRSNWGSSAAAQRCLTRTRGFCCLCSSKSLRQGGETQATGRASSYCSVPAKSTRCLLQVCFSIFSCAFVFLNQNHSFLDLHFLLNVVCLIRKKKCVLYLYDKAKVDKMWCKNVFLLCLRCFHLCVMQA